MNSRTIVIARIGLKRAAQVRKLVAERDLEIEVMKEVAAKNW